MTALDYAKISQGTVYDPANGIDGQVRDLWIADGKIVEAPVDPSVRPSRVIDASGLVVMSTDHPNGGSFLAYPQIIRLLMDRTYRRDILQTCHPLVRERLTLGDLDREYTLNEIAIITRAGPARILGLKDKGHLGPGADADLTIDTPHENKEVMFEMPRVVIKSGRVIVEQGEIRNPLIGKTLHVIPDYDPDVEPDIQAWFEKYYSIQWRNDPVDLAYLHESAVVPTRRRLSHSELST